MLNRRIIQSYSLPKLLNGRITVGLTARVLTEKDSLWHSVLKSNKRMLPVSYMITKSNVQYFVSKIVAVKVKPKRINDSFAFINHDKHSRSITSASSHCLPGLGDSSFPGYLIGYRGRGLAISVPHMAL